MFNLHSKDVVMKKLLIVALVAASFVGIAQARCGRNNNDCCPKKECKQRCEPKKCIRAACIVGCETSQCEGDKPQICSLEPARVDVIKHVDTNVFYTCADRGPCQVVPTDAQVAELIADGSLPEGTKPCPR